MNNSTNYDYSDAKVLVTGGTSGIGYGIASAFARAGASVTVTGTRASAAEYDDVDLGGFTFKTLKVQDTEAIIALAASLDGLDILINNAGASMPGGDEWEHDGFEESIRVNLLSAYHMSRSCLEHLKASTINGGARRRNRYRGRGAIHLKYRQHIANPIRNGDRRTDISRLRFRYRACNDIFYISDSQLGRSVCT